MEKEELIAILTSDSNRKQSVNFPTNKHNNNILDVVIHPLESEILEIKEAEYPDTYKDEPGTDHKWLKIEIKKEEIEVNEEKEITTKKVNYGRY